MQGTHILFREFAFVSATPHNRACFVHKFFATYSHLNSSVDLMSDKEFHALLTLISFDFPLEIVQKSVKYDFFVRYLNISLFQSHRVYRIKDLRCPNDYIQGFYLLFPIPILLQRYI